MTNDVWPNDSTFSSTFQLLIVPQRASATHIYHHLYLPANETLLCILSLDFLDKVPKRLNFHSTTALSLDFFGKDLTYLSITRLHSALLDSLKKVAKRLDFLLDFLSSKNSSEKSSRLARA